MIRHPKSTRCPRKVSINFMAFLFSQDSFSRHPFQDVLTDQNVRTTQDSGETPALPTPLGPCFRGANRRIMMGPCVSTIPGRRTESR